MNEDRPFASVVDQSVRRVFRKAISEHVLADQKSAVNAELREHLGEVVSHGAVADEQPLADLTV